MFFFHLNLFKVVGNSTIVRTCVDFSLYRSNFIRCPRRDNLCRFWCITECGMILLPYNWVSSHQLWKTSFSTIIKNEFYFVERNFFLECTFLMWQPNWENEFWTLNQIHQFLPSSEIRTCLLLIDGLVWIMKTNLVFKVFSLGNPEPMPLIAPQTGTPLDSYFAQASFEAFH